MDLLKGIKAQIKKYRELSSSDLFHTKRIWEYNTFKRYTTSKKDHAPHTRLVYNVRKQYPIQIMPTLPESYQGYRLCKKQVDVGESKRILGTIHCPDYWMFFGEQTTKEIAEALIGPEMEKVQRFFQASWGDMQYGHLLPYRKPVSIVPVIQEVTPSSIGPTLEQVFCPQFSTLDAAGRANKEAVEKITKKIRPLLELKSTPTLVHIARTMITQRKKWVPVTIDTNPITAELSHFLYSCYHYMPVSKVQVIEANAIERLCAEMVTWATKTWDPKKKLLELMDKITIKGSTITSILESLDSDKQFTCICKAAANIPIHLVNQVRETKFVIMNRDAERISVEATKRFGTLSYKHSYQRFLGLYKVFFTWRHVKGMIIGRDQEIEKILIFAEQGDYLLPLILDILYYTAGMEPGFEETYDQYVEKKDLFKHFFDYHSKNPIYIYRTLKVAPVGILANSFHWAIESEGYIKKVQKMESSVQPYSAYAAVHKINEKLEVYRVSQHSMQKLIDPAELTIPKTPLPLGLDATATELVDVITNPLVKSKTMWTKLITDPARCKAFVYNALSETPDPFLKTIQQTLPARTRKANKRRLEELVENDPEWVKSPEKRYKAAFDASILVAGKSRKRPTEGPPINKVPLTNLGESLDYNMAGGLIISTGTKIRVMSQVVIDTSTTPLEGFVYTGVYTEKPNGMEVTTLEEARKKKLKRVCLMQHNRYYVLEEKESLWSAAENIRTTIEHQQSLIKASQAEAFLQSLPGPSTQRD
uniref:PB2 protein n=1 Tax=Thogotovirus dhoriense TaxID=11318 RepID=A0A7M1I6Q3_9ORTO|nr:PB2 protein [Thogotovirus dhoriense]